MADLKGSKTWENLQTAFAGEAQAHTKYQYYAKKAAKEGLNIISSIFEETAQNEKEHAKLWFKALHDDDVPLTKQNLMDAIAGEDHESQVMYKEFAETADAEGFTQLASLFRMVGKIETDHSKRYSNLLNSLESDKLFKSEDPILWICTNCGHLHIGKEPPVSCPVCKHPQAYFVRENRKYN
ncbi:MAG: rubrerythrin [Mycoplasma sp.]